MIETPARRAARSAALSGGPTQTEGRGSLDGSLDDGSRVAACPELTRQERHQLARPRNCERPLIARTAPDLP